MNDGLLHLLPKVTISFQAILWEPGQEFRFHHMRNERLVQPSRDARLLPLSLLEVSVLQPDLCAFSYCHLQFHVVGPSLLSYIHILLSGEVACKFELKRKQGLQFDTESAF